MKALVLALLSPLVLAPGAFAASNVEMLHALKGRSCFDTKNASVTLQVNLHKSLITITRAEQSTSYILSDATSDEYAALDRDSRVYAVSSAAGEQLGGAQLVFANSENLNGRVFFLLRGAPRDSQLYLDFNLMCDPK